MQITNRTLDELAPGDSAELRRLITPDDLYVFAASSGNYNPRHLSDSDLDGDGETDRVAPGMFVASLISAVLGTQLPGAGTLYRRQLLDFHERAHAGDELVCQVEVCQKLDDGLVRLTTTVRRPSDGALILSGEADVLPPATKISLQQVEVPGLIVQRHRHFEALLERARPLPALPTAVVCPHDTHSLAGAMRAARESIITPLLIGRADAIRTSAAEAGEDVSGMELVHVPGHDEAASALACASSTRRICRRRPTSTRRLCRPRRCFTM